MSTTLAALQLNATVPAWRNEGPCHWLCIMLLWSIGAQCVYLWSQQSHGKRLLVLTRAPTDHDVNLAFGTDYEYGLFSREFARRHGLQLLGTTTTWFLLDIAFYSQNLFQKDVFTAIGWLPAAKTMSGLQEVFKISRAQALIALCSTVPGYWFTVAFIDILGRWIIQLGGFFFMTLFMFILSLDYYNLRGQPCSYNTSKYCGGNHIAFVVLYALTFFFANFGPNATTFIIPAELFPARLRTTCHGISAAAGKAGAIVGAFGFLYAAQGRHAGEPDPGYNTGIGVKDALLVLACVNAAGFFFTFLLPETACRSLEELSGEFEVPASPGTGQDQLLKSAAPTITVWVCWVPLSHQI